jgi:transcriptional regulator with XRE-family HTH domain
MINRAFSVVLRRLRKQKGLSQEQFGFDAGLHRTYVSQLERGLKSPSLLTLHKISNALEIRLTELIKLVEQENSVQPDQ